MKKELTIRDIEMQIEHIEYLFNFGMSMQRWSMLISKYHALHIKLANMKGEHVSADYSKSDYII